LTAAFRFIQKNKGHFGLGERNIQWTWEADTVPTDAILTDGRVRVRIRDVAIGLSHYV